MGHLQSLFSSSFDDDNNYYDGSSPEQPLRLIVGPALVPFLDVALLRTAGTEQELEHHLHAAHAVWYAWKTVELLNERAAQVAVQEEDQEEEDEDEEDTTEEDPQEEDESSPQTHRHSSSSTTGADPHDPAWRYACYQAAQDCLRVMETEVNSQQQQQLQHNNNSNSRNNATTSLGAGEANNNTIVDECLQLSSLLYCPDHVWAEHVLQVHQRWLRQLTKLHPRSSSSPASDDFATLHNHTHHHNSHSNHHHQKPAMQQGPPDPLDYLIHTVLPERLAAFAQTVAPKRWVLIKNEYRVPIRAWLEAHQAVRRAPRRDWLENPKPKKSSDTDELSKLLATPALQEALALEKVMEDYTTRLAQSWPAIAEVARWWLLLRKGSSRSNHHVVGLSWKVLSQLAATDVRAVLRLFLGDSVTVEMWCQNVNTLLTRSKDVVPHTLLKNAWQSWSDGGESLSQQVRDWCRMVSRQHSLLSAHPGLVEQIRQAEWQQRTGTEVVLQRLDAMCTDREHRFRVLERMVSEVCVRELNLHVELIPPQDDDEDDPVGQGVLLESLGLFSQAKALMAKESAA